MSARRIFTSISLILVLFCASSFGKFSGGTGEPNDPYLIATSNDLNSIGLDPCDWDKHFLMTADINLSSFSSGISFIGHFGGMWPHPDNKPFEGVFDGDGHRISNLVCRYEGFYNSYGLALFSYVAGEGAEIKNLGISDPCIYGNSKTWYIGALVGVLDGARITNCYVTGGSVHGDGGYIAGVVGGNSGIISGCSVKGCTVSVDGGMAGAITGQNSDGEIEYCFAKASVSGNGYIGGLVGVNKGPIKNSYAICDVNGQSGVGGFVGDFFSGEISRSYSASVVTGSELIGAFSGLSGNELHCQLNSCFWDTELNPGLPGNGNGDDPNLTGLPTAQMQMRSTFADAGWDMIDVWDIGENQTYPFLRTHLPSDINKDGETNLYDLAILALNWLAE